MQALQLKRAAAARAHLRNGRYRGCVVRGELGVDHIGRVQQGASAGQVRNIGMVLVREHRVMRQAQLLGAFDFGIPIRAFDQAAHQAHAMLARHGHHGMYQFQGAALVSLQSQAQAAPLRPVLRHALQQSIKHFERQLQALHLFSIYRQVDVGACGLLAQAPHPRQQLGHDARALAVFVARVQRAQFDADAVIALRPTTGHGGLRQGAYRVAITLPIAQRVGICARTLAQHVIRKTQALALRLAGRISMAHGLGHGLAQHKLAAQQLHRAQRSSHHGVRAQAAHQAAAAGGALGIGQKVFGHGNRRARQTRQHLVAGLRKIGAAQLVGGQGDGSVHVRHAQQCFGQAHKGQALGAGNRVLLQQTFHGPKRRGMVSHGLHPGRGHLRGSGPVQLVLQAAQALCHGLCLGQVGLGKALMGQHRDGSLGFALAACGLWLAACRFGAAGCGLRAAGVV